MSMIRATSSVLLIALLAWPVVSGENADPSSEAYSPVVSAEPIRAAARSQLEVVREWLLDKDFASAGEAAQGLGPLAQLLSHQYSSGEGQAAVKEFHESAADLAARTKQKDGAGSGKALASCSQHLDALAALPAE